MLIAVDFDGTLFTENLFPKVGLPIFKNINKVLQLQELGHTLILWTCRTGQALKDAINASKKVGIYFSFINENYPERIKDYDIESRKINADIYIDDRAIRPEDIDFILEKQENIWE